MDYWLTAGQTALEFLRNAKELGVTTPIVIMTNGDSFEIDEQAMRGGAADFLGKGDITTPLFERVIRHVLIRHNAMTQLIEEAAYDPLTQCLSRLYFQRRAEYCFTKAKAANEPISCLAIDVDGLKQVNDKHGHEAGDTLLSIVSKCCHQILRHNDFIGRLGGDEFVAILPGCSGEHATLVAERVLETINEVHLKLAGAIVRPAVSIGVADNRSCDHLKEMTRQADAALYQVKNAGGNHFMKLTTDTLPTPNVRNA